MHITGFGKIIKILNHDVYLVSNRTENVLFHMTGPDKHNASSPSPVTQPWGQKKPNMSLCCILGSLFLIPSLIVSVKNSLVTVCTIVMTSNLLIHAQYTQWIRLYFYRAKKKESIFSEVNNFATQFWVLHITRFHTYLVQYGGPERPKRTARTSNKKNAAKAHKTDNKDNNLRDQLQELKTW